MKKQKQLLIARNIFAFILFVILGVIVVTEKSKEMFISNAEKEITKYIEKNYKEIEKETIQEKVTRKNTTYQAKLVSKDNKHLYFYIKKKKTKITDTYKEDYEQGKTLFTYLEKEIEKEIKEKTNVSLTVTISTTLDQHTTATKERILKEENLLELKFYTIQKEIVILDWSKEEITKKITDTMNIFEEQSITPKNYTIIITNSENESIEIKNLTADFINNSQKEEIIHDIIEDNNSKLLKENKITYKYLEEE